MCQPKHMLWVLKRTVSMRRVFLAPKTNVKTDDRWEKNYNFSLNTLKNCVYLDLRKSMIQRQGNHKFKGATIKGKKMLPYGEHNLSFKSSPFENRK